MGVFLSVLVASVGVMDLVNCLAYISDQFSTRTTAIDEDLERYRRLLKEKLDDAPKGARDGLTYAQDGVVYKDGYRVERFDEARLDQLNVKIRELERKSHEKDERLDQLNVQLQELERKSAEREIVIEEIRSRSLSRAISPDPTSSRGSTVLRDIPKILLDDEDSRASSKKFRPIYRDDELRRTIKKRSVSSNVSDDRSEELEALTRLEDDEATQMEDYEPLVYSRNDYQDPSSSKNKISPIQELCAMHENEYQQRKTESPSESVVVATGLDVEEDDRLEQLNQRLHSKSASPESTPEEASLTSSDDEHSQILSPSNVPNDHFEDLGALAQQEEVSVIHKNEEPRRMTESPSKSLTEPDSDDAEEKEIINWSNSRNTLPEIPNLTKELLLTTSESVPSNLSSRSGSPDPDHPALKRTRKKSDLTALLLEEERRTQAFREVIIQTEEYDSEASERSELQQSKSLTPSINNFLNNERASSAGQLQSPISDKSNSSTSEHESQQSSIASIPPSDSREPTISPVPIVSLGSAALNASSNADGSVEGVPARSDEDRSISSPAVPADRNLIFSGEYTKAMSKDWHSGHFCCWQCDESLTGQRYVLRDEHPYCIKCYENVFANICEECNKTIGIDSKDLSYKDKHWHEACFLCNKCRISLVDKQFGSKADKIYCGNCYDAQFASRCDGCGEIFRAGTKKMEYKTRQWHEKCFCCCVCKTAIGTKSFIPREQEIYCAGCYEEKYATRCIKCKKIITSGGVTYKNEPWHRECFTCTHCQVSLAGQRFTSRDEKPYCAECFGELFAKRCTSCIKPITGIGGTRFISFEDRHWHNDCFICAICKTSLVGRGFITDEQDVICPECAKQKLM
ncbi:paxillin isoform X3 [Malaya genurostris]|uniref:paxillin isoform X3 n=2 Tax=Malaya genurostris TaxID=325434 RepID=UPI0026F3D0D7|nr:paxillin isoform X3 [Malaya genurostris]